MNMNRIRSASVRTNSSKNCFVSLSGDLAEAVGLRIQVRYERILACILIHRTGTMLLYDHAGFWRFRGSTHQLSYQGCGRHTTDVFYSCHLICYS